MDVIGLQKKTAVEVFNSCFLLKCGNVPFLSVLRTLPYHRTCEFFFALSPKMPLVAVRQTSGTLAKAIRILEEIIKKSPRICYLLVVVQFADVIGLQKKTAVEVFNSCFLLKCPTSAFTIAHR